MGTWALLESMIYSVKILKIGKISFFLISRPPLGKIVPSPLVINNTNEANVTNVTNVMCGCTHVCTGVRKGVRDCVSIYWCAQVCVGLCGYTLVCPSVRGWVREYVGVRRTWVYVGMCGWVRVCVELILRIPTEQQHQQIILCILCEFFSNFTALCVVSQLDKLLN